MTKQQINEDAYRRLKPEIDSTFEEGWFIAIDDGKIIAVQAVEDYLESATIFL